MLGGTYVNGWRILVTYTGTHVTDWLRTDQKTSASLAARPSRRTPTEYAIIDELGYLPFDTQTANLFFQLVAARYEQGSILITSNLSFGRWGEAFGDDTVTSAMIDHLVHHAEVLPMDGESYRTRTRREMLSESESDDPGRQSSTVDRGSGAAAADKLLGHSINGVLPIERHVCSVPDG